jgi:hypothetical protein
MTSILQPLIGTSNLSLSVSTPDPDSFNDTMSTVHNTVPASQDYPPLCIGLMLLRLGLNTPNAVDKREANVVSWEGFITLLNRGSRFLVKDFIRELIIRLVRLPETTTEKQNPEPIILES